VARLSATCPHARAEAAAAEAAALQRRFWDMHELLFHRQKALEDDDVRAYAAQLGLDVPGFDDAYPGGCAGTMKVIRSRSRRSAPTGPGAW